MYQAIRYCGSFYLTFIFGTIARILQIFDRSYYGIFVCMTIFFPLQGFWQFLIYTRPRRQAQQRKQRLQRQQQQQLLRSGGGGGGGAAGGVNNNNNNNNDQNDNDQYNGTNHQRHTVTRRIISAVGGGSTTNLLQWLESSVSFAVFSRQVGNSEESGSE